MSRTMLICSVIAVAFLASTLVAADAPKKGKDGKDDIVGAVWEYTLKKGDEKASGKFRVFNNEIFRGSKKVGKIEPVGDGETTITITDWDEMNGTAKLRRNRKEPAGGSGTFKKKDGSEWEMKVTWKDG